MASRFSDHVCKSLTLNASFSALTKRWALILLSKLSEHYAIIGKWIKIYVNFGDHGPLRVSNLAGKNVPSVRLSTTSNSCALKLDSNQ